MRIAQQIPLNIHLNDEATLDNFYVEAGSSNALAVDAVRELLKPSCVERYVYLWANPTSGLSHLLQACCHESQHYGLQSQYLPLQEMLAFDPVALLDGFEYLDLVCLDGIQHVLGRPDWDKALFHLYNKSQERGCRLLVAANCAPKDLVSTLQDLSSRLAWGTAYRLEAMTDIQKQQALQLRAGLRGLDMSDEVARFILNHVNRDPHRLFECLKQLDHRSLAERRKLTIPFVKEVL